MEHFLDGESWFEGLIISLTALVAFVAVAWYVIGKVRPKPIQEESLTNIWMTKYRDLHDRGVLSDQEYRTIKSVLTAQLQEELKRNSENGSNE